MGSLWQGSNLFGKIPRFGHDVKFPDARVGAHEDQSFANDTDADNFNMWQTTLYNMYTPSTQNTNAREFSIAYKTNGYTNTFNAGQNNGTICWETVSSITIMEVASSIYS